MNTNDIGSPRQPDRPMRSLTVAVTGVGAIIGQGIVKSLRQSRYAPRIIGIDRSANSPGPRLCDAFEQKPDAPEDSQAYLDYWARIVLTHGIDLILPGLELDMTFLDAHRQFFSALNAKLALNNAELIHATADKWDFGQELIAIGYPAIPSARPNSWAQAIEELGPAPLLLKPRRGNGSRGIVLLEDEADFDYWRKKAIAPWMLQRVVGSADEEYTVGVFGLGDRRQLQPLIFRRRLSSAGNTLVAEVVREHAVIGAATERLCQHFQPLGPTNFQFRVEAGTAYLLEINPRFSSSNSLRSAFGFNEAEMAIQLYLLGMEPTAPRITAGKAWRYTEDFVTHAGHTL
ncbi:ATP-grasp domain-containing protein [Achromobacter mucicolens]|uniref:ATP-grasp domain-containing protein n=1 Tax=Achromobacter mucicolens TaxID=1389922 RepID=UPI0020A33D69|nr:ATP-grasp domain-containing protein [Achromobacter mucicolens]MCP2513933.1 ATP-grasp domain-containing protein [Achromobacter mucicolens]